MNDNIDLFPEGFLWARGCDIARGNILSVTTPKRREFQVLMWGNMPYITKNTLQQILSDLQEPTEAGTDGHQAPPPTAARASTAKVDLSHAKGWLSKDEISKTKMK